MQRDYRTYLEDILEAINKIERYTDKLSFNDFKNNELIVDGVVRNLEIIGEAVKKVPDEIRMKYSDIEWSKIAGIRDILIHAYFIVDIEILWDVVKNKLPALKSEISHIIDEIH